MNKIKIIGYFKNSNTNTTVKYNCWGKVYDNIIEFQNKEDLIKIEIQKNKILFKRENKDILLYYEFVLNNKSKNNIYRLKKENIEIFLEINTTKIKIEKNFLDIEFNMLEVDNSTCKYKLKLNYKVV